MHKFGLLLFLGICWSCSRSYPVRASLNHTRWFASLSNGTPRIYLQKRLSLIFATDLTHPELAQKRIGKVTGCKGPCQRTQTLLLANIPLRSGLYPIAQPGSDSLLTETIHCEYDAQGVKQIGTRTYTEAKGWLQITEVDSTTGQVKGLFDIRFLTSGPQAKSVHFRRGKLNFYLKKKPLS